MPTSRRRRTLATALPMGRVLDFPVPTDPLGQFELFPEPEPPDHFSVSALVLCFTDLQIRVTKLSTYLSPQKRRRLIEDYHATLVLVSAYERDLARQRELDAEAWVRRIA